MMVAGLVAEPVDRYLRDCAASIDERIAVVLDAEVHDPWMRAAISYHLGWADTAFAVLPPDRRGPSGKRLRPALALLCFEGAIRTSPEAAGGADVDAALTFATAIEILHNYSLIHDDIEDRDEFRRGRPALWTLCGKAQAINVGDCLHDLAYGCLSRTLRCGQHRERAVELMAAFAQAGLRMAVGQCRDLALETESEVSVASYLRMIEGKTAAITRCATYGGALLALGSSAPAAARTLAAYGEFGRELGLGFQIRDDYLGVWGVETETGKPSGSDIRRKKKGLPIVFAFQSASGDALDRLRRVYGSTGDLSGDDEDYVRGVLEDCQAAAFTQRCAELHSRQAIEALTDAAGGPTALRDNPCVVALEELTGALTTRSR